MGRKQTPNFPIWATDFNCIAAARRILGNDRFNPQSKAVASCRGSTAPLHDAYPSFATKLSGLRWV